MRVRVIPLPSDVTDMSCRCCCCPLSDCCLCLLLLLLILLLLLLLLSLPLLPLVLIVSEERESNDERAGGLGSAHHINLFIKYLTNGRLLIHVNAYVAVKATSTPRPKYLRAKLLAGGGVVGEEEDGGGDDDP